MLKLSLLQYVAAKVMFCICKQNVAKKHLVSRTSSQLILKEKKSGSSGRVGKRKTTVGILPMK